MLKILTLEDKYVALVPMSKSHIEGLHLAGQSTSIWKWATDSYCLTLDSTKYWVENMLRTAQQGSLIPFVIIDKQKQKVVGSTSYLGIAPEHKAIEIGFTFLAPQVQRSHINRRCKMLLISYAFETLQYNRVAFQTHEKNQQSRQAILGLGAQFEGILRNCRIQHDGSIRSSAIFSILNTEWPKTKALLSQKLEHYPITQHNPLTI